MFDEFYHYYTLTRLLASGLLFDALSSDEADAIEERQQDYNAIDEIDDGEYFANWCLRRKVAISNRPQADNAKIN